MSIDTHAHHHRLDFVFLLRNQLEHCYLPPSPRSSPCQIHSLRLETRHSSTPSPQFKAFCLLHAFSMHSPLCFSSFDRGKLVLSSAVLQCADRALQYSLSHLFGICASAQYQSSFHLALGDSYSPEPSFLSSSLLSTLPFIRHLRHIFHLWCCHPRIISDLSQAFGTSLLYSHFLLHPLTNSSLQPLTHCFSLSQPERSGLWRSLATTLRIFSGRLIAVAMRSWASLFATPCSRQCLKLLRSCVTPPPTRSAYRILAGTHESLPSLSRSP